jgi:hypothetical protein
MGATFNKWIKNIINLTKEIEDNSLGVYYIIIHIINCKK